MLQELGLRTVIAPPVYDNEIPVNSVISTNPPAGTLVTDGEVVTLTYSNGPQPVAVPPLVGQPEEAARAALNQVGLTPGLRVQEPSAQVVAGSVVRLEPEVGTEVSPGQPITLVVSSGPPPVVLPRVIGLTEEEATLQLTEAGLEVEVDRRRSVASEAGRVIDQSPVPGTVAGPGSEVTLTVSTGG